MRASGAVARVVAKGGVIRAKYYRRVAVIVAIASVNASEKFVVSAPKNCDGRPG